MEKTPKPYKLLQTAGVFLILFGVVGASVSISRGSDGTWASIPFFGGFLGYFLGRFIPWMKHG